MSPSYSSRTFYKPFMHQRGAALIVGLMILTIMTIIGITAMGSTTLEERMANNTRQRQVAFQSAEAALRDAEGWIATNVTNVANLNQFDGTVAGLYTLRSPVVGMSPLAPAPTFSIYDENGWLAAGNYMSPTVTLSSVNRQPRYIIEYMGRVGQPPLNYTDPDVRQYAFRVTAMGWGEGANPTSRYLAWSSFRLPLN
jgi:type IV pilus assembly protein PilX